MQGNAKNVCRDGNFENKVYREENVESKVCREGNVRQGYVGQEGNVEKDGCRKGNCQEGLPRKKCREECLLRKDMAKQPIC